MSLKPAETSAALNHFRSARWPKALALFTEEGISGASFVKGYTLMTEAAYCTKCGWRGPLRGPSEGGQVEKDAVAHYRWHQRMSKKATPSEFDGTGMGA